MSLYLVFLAALLAPAALHGQEDAWQSRMDSYRLLYDQGKYADALRYVEDAAKLSEGFEHGDARTWQSHESLAITLDNLSRIDEAHQLYSRMLLGELGVMPDPARRARLLRNIGRIQLLKRKTQDAEKFYREALQADDEYLSEDDPRRADGLVATAGFYLTLGRHQDALPYAERGVQLSLRLPGNVSSRMNALDVLAGIYNTTRDFEKARPIYEQLLAETVDRYGPDHPRVVRYAGNLGALHLMQGDLAKANTMFRRVLAIREATLGKENPALAMALNNLALTLDPDKDRREVESLLQRALRLEEIQSGALSPNLSTPLQNLGMFYAKVGDDGKAETYLRRAVTVEQDHDQARDQKRAANALLNFATFLMKQKRFQEAEPFALRALDVVDKAATLSDDADVVMYVNSVVALYSQANQHGKALPFAKRALTLTETFKGTSSRDYADATFRLATATHKIGQLGQADDIYVKASSLYEKLDQPAMVARVLREHAELLKAARRPADAKVLIARADELDRPAK